MKNIKKLLVAFLALLFISNTHASAEEKKDDNIIAGFIVIDDVKQTVQNIEKKYNIDLPDSMPFDYFDNTIISLWASEKDKIGVAGTNDNNFLSLLRLDLDAKAVSDDLGNNFNFPITDTLKNLLDESKMTGKTFSAYIVKHENYFVIVERQELNDKKPTFNLTISADEKFYVYKLNEYKLNDKKN